MQEYIGKSGNKTYLISFDTDEGYSFNQYGENISHTTALLAYEDSKSKQEIDILSFVGDPVLDICELYFQGKILLVRMGYFEAFSRLSKSMKVVDGMIYRLKHVDEGVMQLIIPCKKGTLTCNTINILLGEDENLSWSNLL